MTLKQSRREKKDMRNTDSVTIDNKTRELIIKIPDTYVQLSSILTTVTMSVLDEIKEKANTNLYDACVYANCKMILENSEGAYEQIVREYNEVQNDSTD